MGKVLDDMIETVREFERTYGPRPELLSGETHDLAALSRSLSAIFKPYPSHEKSSASREKSLMGMTVDTLFGVPIFSHPDVPPGVLRLYAPNGELVGEITGIGEEDQKTRDPED